MSGIKKYFILIRREFFLNKFVASGFAVVLSLLHIAVIGLLLLALFYQDFGSLVGMGGVPGSKVWTMMGGESGDIIRISIGAFLILILYVLIVGVFSTIISTNQYLREIRDLLKK